MENRNRKKFKVKMKPKVNIRSKKRIVITSVVLLSVLAVFLIGACGKIQESKETKRLQEIASAETRAKEAATHLAEETQAASIEETEPEGEPETETELATKISNTRSYEVPTQEFSIEEFTGIASGRSVSTAVIPYDGIRRSVTCWGDSLTEGYGTSSLLINGIAYATEEKAISYYTGLTVYNMGVLGEDSRTIACREGGLKMYVNNITIPASGSISFGEIMCSDGAPVDMCRVDNAAQRECFNSCTLGGVTGKLTFNGDDGLYTFTRAVPGEAISTESAQLITATSVTRSGDILILEIGNNNGWDQDMNKLIAQYDSMIESAGCQYYIIVGDTDGIPIDDDGSTDRRDMANILHEAYGAHFIDIREYLAENGMADCGLTPTADDLYAMSRGAVPDSLKSDWSHLNAYGYWSKGKALYLKGVELGFWPAASEKQTVEASTVAPTVAPTEAQTEPTTQATTQSATEKTTEATTSASEQTTASHTTSGAQ